MWSLQSEPQECIRYLLPWSSPNSRRGSSRPTLSHRHQPPHTFPLGFTTPCALLKKGHRLASGQTRQQHPFQPCLRQGLSMCGADMTDEGPRASSAYLEVIEVEQVRRSQGSEVLLLEPHPMLRQVPPEQVLFLVSVHTPRPPTWSPPVQSGLATENLLHIDIYPILRL